MIARLTMSLVALAILAPAAAAAQKTSERDVASARAVFAEVRDAIAAGRMVRSDTSVTCDDLPSDVEVRRFAHRSGQVRRLTISGAGEDHVEAVTYFYDAAGQLRFALATRGAVNGTREEERAWYSPAGAVAHRETRRIRGPGYPFESIRAVADAGRWRTAACGEEPVDSFR